MFGSKKGQKTQKPFLSLSFISLRVKFSTKNSPLDIYTYTSRSKTNMFASTTASTHISCSQIAKVSSAQRKSSNTRMASSATSSSSSSFSSSFETRRFMKLNVARNVREAKGANERGMALLAKATAEVRIQRFFYTFSAQRCGRDDGEFRRGGFFYA